MYIDILNFQNTSVVYIFIYICSEKTGAYKFRTYKGWNFSEVGERRIWFAYDRGHVIGAKTRPNEFHGLRRHCQFHLHHAQWEYMRISEKILHICDQTKQCFLTSNTTWLGNQLEIFQRMVYNFGKIWNIISIRTPIFSVLLKIMIAPLVLE